MVMKKVINMITGQESLSNAMSLSLSRFIESEAFDHESSISSKALANIRSLWSHWNRWGSHESLELLENVPAIQKLLVSLVLVFKWFMLSR